MKNRLRKCRAVESEENQKQVSLAAHKPLEIALAIPTFPQPRPLVPLYEPKNERRIQSPPVTLFFRLISGLENAVGTRTPLSNVWTSGADGA
jgi:hypothetical protein